MEVLDWGRHSEAVLSAGPKGADLLKSQGAVG